MNRWMCWYLGLFTYVLGFTASEVLVGSHFKIVYGQIYVRKYTECVFSGWFMLETHLIITNHRNDLAQERAS